MIYISFAQPHVPAPVTDCDGNCCDTDLSQSSGLYLRVDRLVLLSSIPLSPALTVVDDL